MWDVLESMEDYRLGSVTMISDFVEYLQTEQLLKLSVVIEATEIRQKHTVHYLLRLKYTFNG